MTEALVRAFACDEERCEEEFSVDGSEARTRRSAWALARKAGWQVRGNPYGWPEVHFCPQHRTESQ